jgi:hypothetical protein
MIISSRLLCFFMAEDDLEITVARFVATIAIELNRVARAFTSGAAVLGVG